MLKEFKLNFINFLQINWMSTKKIHKVECDIGGAGPFEDI